MNKNNASRLTLALIPLLWLSALLSAAAKASDNIESVRLHRAPDHTRIVFDLPKPVEHSLQTLTGPDRVVVDLMDSTLAADLSALDYANSPIASIRSGQHADKVRVVFDMKEGVRPRTNLLKPIEPHGWRLVVDLFDKDPVPVQSVAAKAQERAQERGEPRPMIVALDPGHGGEDPGAIGPSGTYEKDIVLQIARRVKTLMDEAPGMRAVLVRTGDYYVPLAERRRVAKEDHDADVFISIHADAFTDPRANGASVFALSNGGATSARARYLAKMANDSDRVAGVYEDEKDDSNLLSVLADLQVTGSMSHSLYMGRQVLEQLEGVTRLHGGRKTVEQAGFAVLKEPRMVSILIETGFISNPQEERNLRSASHQQKLARAIVNGVDDYFRNHAAPDSWYAAQRSQEGNQHRIRPGDTLSEIARQYRVSEQALRSANNLNGDRIMVGQVLKIPRS